jgi:hypothetical protein
VYPECLVGELAALAGKKVFLAAATLRPETMVNPKTLKP